MTHPSVTREQMREMDRIAIEEYGIPGVVLMENAGQGAARHTLSLRGDDPGPVLVLAGRGNNGGDGFVMARRFHNHGVPADVVFLGDLDAVASDSDAGINLYVLLKMGVLIREMDGADFLPSLLERSSVVVDALLGTGLSGLVREPYRTVIDRVNESGRSVLAVDTPSGLDVNTGEILGTAIRARRTVTFGLPKTGFTRGQGPECTGEVIVQDISLPRAVVKRVLEGTSSGGERT